MGKRISEVMGGKDSRGWGCGGEDSRGSGVQRILDRGVTGGRGFQGKGYRERLFLEGREVWGERIPVERSMRREKSKGSGEWGRRIPEEAGKLSKGIRGHKAAGP